LSLTEIIPCEENPTINVETQQREIVPEPLQVNNSGQRVEIPSEIPMESQSKPFEAKEEEEKEEVEQPQKRRSSRSIVLNAPKQTPPLKKPRKK
jgi:hypothetical protein